MKKTTAFKNLVFTSLLLISLTIEAGNPLVPKSFLQAGKVDVSNLLPASRPNLKNPANKGNFRPMRLKQAEGTKCRMDSITLKFVIGNDSSCSRYRFEFDSNGSQTMETNHLYNLNTKELRHKHTCQYGDNFMVKNEYESSDGVIQFTRTKTTYNEKGQIRYVFATNDSLDFEVLPKKEEYVYVNDRLNEILYYSDVNPNELNTRYQYYYDKSGRDSVEIELSLDSWNNKWKQSQKREYFYDSLGRDTTEILYYGSPFLKFRRLYDNAGNIIRYEEFENFGTNYIISYAADYQYNNNNDCIFSNSIEYGFSNPGEIVGKDEYFLHYDELTPKTNVTNQHFFEENKFGFSYNSKIETVGATFKDVDSNIIADFSMAFYYSEVDKGTNDISPIQEPGKGDIRYNPQTKCLESIHASGIEHCSVMVYNANGAVVTSKSFNASGNIELPNLQRGIYIYKTTNNGQTMAGKFMVR